MLRSANRVALLLTLCLVGVSACGDKKPDPSAGFTEEDLAINPVANFQTATAVLSTPDRNGVVDYETAYTSFVKSAELFDANSDANGSLKAHFNAAKAAEVLGRTDSAIKHYEAAVQADASHQPSMFSLARVYNANGQADKAVELFKQYTASHPDDLEVRNDLIAGLVEAERYDEALAEAQAVLRIDPENAAVYRNLSALYYKQENYGMSQLCNEKALELKDSDPGIYNNMGVTALLQENEPKAIENFKTAVKIDPDNYEANMNLGFVALNSGDYELALGCFRKSVEANPASIDAKLGLAVALRGTQAFDESAEVYEDILKADPENRMAYFNAATLHEKYTKNYNRALKYLQGYVDTHEVSPDDEVFGRMERVKQSKAEEDERKRLEEQRRREAEEREARNRELLGNLGAQVGKYQTELQGNASCLDPMMVEEGMMILEQVTMVVEMEDVSMAQDIGTLLESYIPSWDEAIATCAGGGAPEEPVPETPDGE